MQQLQVFEPDTRLQIKRRVSKISGGSRKLNVYPPSPPSSRAPYEGNNILRLPHVLEKADFYKCLIELFGFDVFAHSIRSNDPADIDLSRWDVLGFDQAIPARQL